MRACTLECMALPTFGLGTGLETGFGGPSSSARATARAKTVAVDSGSSDSGSGQWQHQQWRRRRRWLGHGRLDRATCGARRTREKTRLHPVALTVWAQGHMQMCLVHGPPSGAHQDLGVATSVQSGANRGNGHGVRGGMQCRLSGAGCARSCRIHTGAERVICD